MTAWADSLDARRGDTLSVAIRVDLSALGASIGSYQAALRFDTNVLSFVSILGGEFQGTFTANTDSAGTGFLRFAGINTSAGVNTGITVVALARLVVTGSWGARGHLDLSVAELVTVDFTNVTGQVGVQDGVVRVNPGTLRVALRGEETISRDEPRPLTLWGFLADLAPTVGALQGRILFDPTVARVDSVRVGSFGGTFDANTGMQSDSGFVRFAVVHTSPPDPDSVDFLRIWVTGLGQGGDTTTVSAVLEEISDPILFSDLLPFLVANDGIRLTVTTGIWGDPNKDKNVTALDALICLSHVVGKDVSQFDPTACDVAPDDGEAFTGRVTALDALAILSHVVGKALPATFRVGRSR